ncbi:hypothetical protein [Streptomyces sp. DSM 41033]|uniref:hypothetical protein n=1 Tax=Streptomyces sp. DSM 41033 TaxID=3448655 RepID=UPI0040402632
MVDAHPAVLPPEVRSRFGAAADGQPYLPRLKKGYEFHTGIRCDWDYFQELATRGLAAGPDHGIRDLTMRSAWSAASRSQEPEHAAAR